jgi:hypothetical protein
MEKSWRGAKPDQRAVEIQEVARGDKANSTAQHLGSEEAFPTERPRSVKPPRSCRICALYRAVAQK